MSSVADLAGTLAGWVERLLPDPPRAARMAADLRAGFAAERGPVTAATLDRVRATGRRHCRHLELEFVADGSLTPDVDPPGWPPVDPADVRRRSAWVRQVTRTPAGVGVLALDGLDPVAAAAPHLEAAFALLAGSRAVVLDLRANGGGDPATVALVMDWALGPAATHYADVVHAGGRRQWWTTGRRAATALPLGTPLAVLIGPGTFSSGEALAWFLRRRTPARLFGEPTPGAADHITPVALTPHVRGFVPEAYYVDADGVDNWEGVGVQPHVPVPAGRALDAALLALA